MAIVINHVSEGELPEKRSGSKQNLRSRAASVPDRGRRRPSSPLQLEQMIPGMHGGFAAEILSPKTPLSRKIHENAKLYPPVVHTHKMCLRDFAEMESSQLRSNSGTPNPPTIQQRSASASGYSSCENSRPNSRMSSKRDSRMSSKQSCGDLGNDAAKRDSRMSSKQSSCGDLGNGAARPSSAVRQLSRSEQSEQIKYAADWFRATQAINRNSRTAEETEALLAAARNRRNKPTVMRSRSVSKSVMVNMTNAPAEEVVKPTPGKMLDPADSCGAKPPVAVAKEEVDLDRLWAIPKPKKQKPIRRTTTLLSGVEVGKTGENSFHARLERKLSTMSGLEN